MSTQNCKISATGGPKLTKIILHCLFGKFWEVVGQFWVGLEVFGSCSIGSWQCWGKLLGSFWKERLAKIYFKHFKTMLSNHQQENKNKTQEGPNLFEKSLPIIPLLKFVSCVPPPPSMPNPIWGGEHSEHSGYRTSMHTENGRPVWSLNWLDPKAYYCSRPPKKYVWEKWITNTCTVEKSDKKAYDKKSRPSKSKKSANKS